MALNNQLLSFAELTAHQLYQILQLRSQVFVLEQNCAYQDMDDLDQQAFHLIISEVNQPIIAYARILSPAEYDNKYSSIGRVVVAESMRQQKLGRQLMQMAIDHTISLFPNVPIKISAQSYLSKFYQSLGFVNTGHFYLEDDIPHQEMIFKPE